MSKTKRFTLRHLQYDVLGRYLDAIRRELGIPIQTLCSESYIGPNTYYKMIDGNIHNLNIYVRFLDYLSGYCDKDTYLRMEHEFMSLACGHIHHHLNTEIPERVRGIWEKHSEI